MFRSPRPAARLAVVAALTLVIALGASPAFAVMSRSLVMSRAQRWVDAKIPYSQLGWANSEGTTVAASNLGWRKDCSGSVSQSWNTFKPGYSTRTLSQTATAITKAAIQPGDALVSYNNHAVLFGGWADIEHETYYAYEMSSSQSKKTGDGTVRRVTPYPYWSWPKDSPYIPYRLNGITENIDYTGFIEPVEGSNRYKTAVAASTAAFEDDTVKSVVVASGENWPDALGASALAGVIGGPVLLTSPDSLPSEVAKEIKRLGAKEAIVVGGDASVSSRVFGALDSITGVVATRVAGADRYETSALIAGETVRRKRLSGTYDGTVFITTGTNFPDALAASPLAAKSCWPILLTKPEELSRGTGNALRTIGAKHAIILGSASAVSTTTEADLDEMLGGTEKVDRLQGRTRYDTGYEIATYGLANCGLGMGGVAIATGEKFPDALAGGVMAAQRGTVLMLTPAKWLDDDVADLLLKNAATVGKPRVLGGETSVWPIVREAIALALGSGTP